MFSTSCGEPDLRLRQGDFLSHVPAQPQPEQGDFPLQSVSRWMYLDLLHPSVFQLAARHPLPPSSLSFPAPSDLRQWASKSAFFLSRKPIKYWCLWWHQILICATAFSSQHASFLLFILSGFCSYNIIFSHCSGCTFGTLLHSLYHFYEIPAALSLLKYSAPLFPLPCPPSHFSAFFLHVFFLALFLLVTCTGISSQTIFSNISIFLSQASSHRLTPSSTSSFSASH